MLQSVSSYCTLSTHPDPLIIMIAATCIVGGCSLLALAIFTLALIHCLKRRKSERSSYVTPDVLCIVGYTDIVHNFITHSVLNKWLNVYRLYV